MNYPTAEEITAAMDAITRDGPTSDVTVALCRLVVTDPNLRRTLTLTVSLLDEFGKDVGQPAQMLREAFVVSCIAKGLNIGLRIGEARMAAVCQ